ncbi:DNA-processing protein DprA [Clostridium sp. PL3]|uniref:DNA-processing protein DprA n=2 Tax=Clostridium thailandense TaxID=2794346 RepID=A0A949TXZ4_9CLOT|nr:DNA-processing protein DprA [Clostridium thailandense]
MLVAISGMAKGIDSYAQTIAVIGCGVDIIYPKDHIKLMEKIIEQGAVISEYPPGTQPDARYFPRRNSLISAFSRKIKE